MNISLLSVLLIFVGGGTGAIARFLITKILPSQPFPYATFSTNIFACILLGVIVGWTAHLNQPLKDNLYFLLATGFCGGFSTFSTLNLETYKLIEQQQYQTALVYTLANVFLGFLAIALGFWIINR